MIFRESKISPIDHSKTLHGRKGRARLRRTEVFFGFIPCKILEQCSVLVDYTWHTTSEEITNTHLMRQVPLERDINIAINSCSWWRLRTKNGAIYGNFDIRILRHLHLPLSAARS